MIKLALSLTALGALYGCATDTETNTTDHASANSEAVAPEVGTETQWGTTKVSKQSTRDSIDQSVVSVERAGHPERIFGIAVDSYHVLTVCPRGAISYRVFDDSARDRFSGRIIAQGPDNLCVLRTDGEMEHTLGMRIHSRIAVGAKVSTRSPRDRSAAWSTSRIEEIQPSETGMHFRIAEQADFVEGQAVFDEDDYLIGLFTRSANAKDGSVTSLNWLPRTLLQGSPCLNDPDPSRGVTNRSLESRSAQLEGNQKDEEENLPRSLALSKFSSMLSRRLALTINPRWYPLGAREKAMEGRRVASLEFAANGQLTKVLIDGPESDELSQGVNALLACAALPDIPKALRGKPFAVTMPFSFKMLMTSKPSATVDRELDK